MKKNDFPQCQGCKIWRFFRDKMKSVWKKFYGNPEPSNPQTKGVLGNVAQSWNCRYIAYPAFCAWKQSSDLICIKGGELIQKHVHMEVEIVAGMLKFVCRSLPAGPCFMSLLWCTKFPRVSWPKSLLNEVLECGGLVGYWRRYGIIGLDTISERSFSPVENLGS